MDQFIQIALLIVIVLLIVLVLLFLYRGYNMRHRGRKGRRHRIVKPPSGFLVTLQQAVELIWTYREGRGKLISDTIGYMDARSGWYSLDTLKQYTAWVEQEARQKNIPVTGMRFYYAAYPKADEGKEYGIKAGYQTLVIFPTTTHKGQNRAFDPRLSIDSVPFFFDHELTKLKDAAMNYVRSSVPDDEGGTIVFKTRENETNSSGLNMSQACPPLGDCV